MVGVLFGVWFCFCLFRVGLFGLLFWVWVEFCLLLLGFGWVFGLCVCCFFISFIYCCITGVCCLFWFVGFDLLRIGGYYVAGLLYGWGLSVSYCWCLLLHGCVVVAFVLSVGFGFIVCFICVLCLLFLCLI